MEERAKLAYIGKILEIQLIENADRIVLATAVCGEGGKWRGIVPKEMMVGERVVVFQPDSLLPKDNPEYTFMAQYKHRVKQRMFRGVPSEALIMPATEGEVGEEVTLKYGVIKWVNPSQLHFSAEAAGLFPTNIPKTDEINLQAMEEMTQLMKGLPYCITLKVDGMSSTAFKHEGKFGVCSRNLELKEGNNAIWKMAKEHEIESWLPEGYAVQWETCGPSVQGNPMGLSTITAFAFQMWNIDERRYLNLGEYIELCKMPKVILLETGISFDKSLDELQAMAKELKYPNNAPAEGIVVRTTQEKWGVVNAHMRRFSFKVMNLLYKG